MIGKWSVYDDKLNGDGHRDTLICVGNSMSITNYSTVLNSDDDISFITAVIVLEKLVFSPLTFGIHCM